MQQMIFAGFLLQGMDWVARTTKYSDSVTLFATSVLSYKDNYFLKLLLEIMVLLKLDFHLKYI